jgi:hypothetical protein
VLGFPAEADVVVEIEGVEPHLDVFAGLAVLLRLAQGRKTESILGEAAPLLHPMNWHRKGLKGNTKP